MVINMTSTPKTAKYGQGDSDESPSPLPGGHKASFRSTKLARRARSFKDDFLEKLSQMRTPTGQTVRSHSPKEKVTKTADVITTFHSEKSPQFELERLAKQVEVALKHFRDVVAKNKLEMLPGNGTIVLDTVWAINLAVKSCAASDNSSSIVSATHHMYQSVARLIKLCDDVLIGGDQSSALQNENVGEVLANVEYAVQNLIKLAIEKLSNGDACKVNLRASFGSTNLDLPSQRNSLPDIPLTPREREILEKTSCVPTLVRSSHSSESILRDSTPPPKPPLPESMLSLPDSTPPPLPPKRRGPRTQQLIEECLSSDNSLLACNLDRMSLRSRSPEDSSSLLSASAGSVDSMLNHSREEEEIQALMDPSIDGDTVLNSDLSELLSSNGSCQCYDYNSTHGPFLQNQHNSNLNDLQVMNTSENRLSNADSGFVSMHSHRSSVHSYTKRNSQQSSISSQWNSQHNQNSQLSTMQSAGKEVSYNHQFQSEHQSSMVKSESIVQNLQANLMQQIGNVQQTQMQSYTQVKQQTSSTTCVKSIASNAVTSNAISDGYLDQDLVDSTSSNVTPPAIPEKTKKKQDRQPSPYDNVSDSSELVFACTTHQSLSTDDTKQEARPPPLPPKKKHIMAYMEMFGNCSHSSDSEFMRHSMHMVEAQWQHIAESSMRSSQARSCSHVTLLGPPEHNVLLPSSISPIPPLPSSVSSVPPALPPKRTRTFSTKSSTSPPPTSPTTLHIEKPPTGKSLPDLLEHTSSLNGSTSLQTSTSDLNAEPCEVSEYGKLQEVDLIEELDISSYLVFKKAEEDGPEIRGGHIDALIIQATKVTKSGNDFAYQEAFLTTYRTFISPYDLVCKLIRRHQHFYCQPDRKARSREAFALLVRAVNDLTPPDFGEKLQQTLMDFVQQLITSGELTLAKALRVKHLERYDAKLLASRSNLPESISLASRSISLLDFKSDQIAEQMTLLDAELFLKIEIPEVLIWAQEQNEERSPNLTRFTEHFNKMSYWARTRILDTEAKDREKCVMKYIKIMKHLRKINNFNSYLALLSALDSAPIRRLEWQKHITEGLKEYCALIDSSSSFRAYRQALAETHPPCIPYIGLVLQDLTFVHIGNSDVLPDRTINFSKRWQQYNIVENMKRFKKGTYNFKKNERIIKFFRNFDDFIGEDAMWQLSESIKPRGKKTVQ